MTHRADDFTFFAELHRVLGLDPAGTDFYTWRKAPPVGELRRMTTWLQQQPSGLGEDELERRMRAEFGPPPQ